MNVNLMTIDCLPAAQAQPTTRRVDKSSIETGWGEKTSREIENNVGNKPSERLKTGDAVQKPEVTQSDNVRTERSEKANKAKDSSFKKVLNNRLKNSQDGQDAAQVDAQSQTSDNKVNLEQQYEPADSSTEVQTNNTSAANQISQAVMNLVAQINPDSSTIAQNTDEGQNAQVQNTTNAQQINQQTTTPQIPVVTPPTGRLSNPASEVMPPGIYDRGDSGKLTPPSEGVVKPVPAQQAQTQSSSVSANATIDENSQTIATLTKQISVNNTVKADLPVIPTRVDTDGQPVPLNQDNQNITETNQVNQPALAPSKVQSVDLAATITPTSGSSDTESILTPQKTGGQHPGKETQTNDNSKNKYTNDTQVNVPQISTERPAFATDISGLTASFNKVQIETVSLKNNETQQQTSGLSFQPVTLQTADLTSSQILSGRPVVADRGASQVNNGSAQDAASSIREQISLSVQNSIQQGERQITVHLNPPELGRVSIKFTERGGELSGTLETTNPQTRAEIQQAIPEILRSLEQSGITIKRIDVSLSDLSRQPAQDFSRDNTAQSQWQQLSQHSFNDAGGNRFTQDSFVSSSRLSDASEFTAAPISDQNHSAPADNRLNVLI